jgi:hypothetical protein
VLESTWRIDHGHYRFAATSARVYRCERNDGCEGGATVGDGLCAAHHHGPLCHLCERGYYMEPVRRRCHECNRRPSAFLSIVYCLVAVVSIFVIVATAVGGQRTCARWPWVQEHWARVYAFATTAGFVMWHSLAVLARFSAVEDVEYPGAFKWMMRIYGLVTFDAAAWLPTPCVRWSYYHTLLAATLAPPLAVVAALGVALLGQDVVRRRGRRGAAATRAYEVAGQPKPDDATVEAVVDAALDGGLTSARLAHCVVTFIVATHAPVCSVLFEFFHFDGPFETAGGDESYLARDFRITLSSERYGAYRAYAILCSFIYVVGLPATAAVLLLGERLRRRRRKKVPRGRESSALCEAYWQFSNRLSAERCMRAAA